MVLHIIIGLSCEVAFQVICGGEVIYPWVVPNCEAVQAPYVEEPILGSLSFECDVVSPVEIVPIEDLSEVSPDSTEEGDRGPITLNIGDPVFDVTGRMVSTYGEAGDLPSGVYFVGHGRRAVIVR